ncbi:hypothetical protein BGZ76_008672 [Entomortierella beljakovae]|nr:hypothetical protein BGZ76_008672 [Entomortierella beljakovae]
MSSLPRTSIDIILHYLEPHIGALQTGFPNSTRPNIPPLTVDQKRQKIETVLVNSPSIFLTKWGSVILYPRPVTQVIASDEVHISDDVASSQESENLKSKEILDLFAPLAIADYEVRIQLVKLYQQQQQLSEHKIHQLSKSHPTVSSSKSDTEQEEVKMDLDENDLFSRSVISQSTRRNRRLNYLLRYLAPPDPSEFVAGLSGSTRSKGSHLTSHSSTRDGIDHLTNNEDDRRQNIKQHTPLSSILSISGSMSNLSFSDSTYFSDAEMQARAPELYQQYIGRFIDNDTEDDSGSSDTIESDDELKKSRRRKSKPKPFGKDVSLIDRILWTVDHPSHNVFEKGQNDRTQAHDRTHEHGVSRSSSHQESIISQQNVPEKTNNQSGPVKYPVARQIGNDSESDFEEEFDTESESEDNEMTVEHDEDRPLMTATGRSDKDKTSLQGQVSPSMPVTPTRDSKSVLPSTEPANPRESTIFGYTSSKNNDHSDEEMELSHATANRKEDQEALRRDFVLLMKQRFLDGQDQSFDYSTVDFDEDLDDLDQENYDGEDKWFDSGEENADNSTYSLSGTGRVAKSDGYQNLRTTFDERVRVWESGAQNGTGDYDY